MAPFKPSSSLCDAPTNLKEAIDWVLRVTGKDGKALNKDKGECICGLAAAVTDLLQSVTLEYHGYQGDTKEADVKKGASDKQVRDHLNGLFSLVQGLGGTSVVRTYIDQLAQVLSALVGWSKIEWCGDQCSGRGCNGKCKYLNDVVPKDRSCDKCGCMKWKVDDPNNEGTPLGRRCQRCSEEKNKKQECVCESGEGEECSTGNECQCAKEGKCCKCCCNKQCGKCSDKCSCVKEDIYGLGLYEHKDSYRSAYPTYNNAHFLKMGYVASWNALGRNTSLKGTITERRHQCARILLGSVCLIWNGLTYMHWTGKWDKRSQRWNNHILDGSGLDDGTLSQWLQALGFPRDMLNDNAPGNRLDAIIWNGLREKLFLGFRDTSQNDYNENTFRDPAMLNYPGLIHTIYKAAFCNDATVFKNGSTSGTTDNDIKQHKRGAIFKLYILSCAYFTGLQRKTSGSVTQTSTSNTPRTIREILYWLSALPYSQAYKGLLDHSIERLKNVAPEKNGTQTLSFYQQGLTHPFTVDEYNLFAHFQAVTQYCPLVLIGIQGGLKGTDKTTEPPIHSLYANTECNFTYPTVPIQVYNQVVHYIRGLFYQLYFLRKQCAVKVALGGKWRECRYGDGVVSKGVISWMCLGCDPMEHDRKSRVQKVKEELVGVKTGDDPLAGALKEVLEKIGEVVVQLGNAQERLDTGKYDLDGVMKALKNVFTGVNEKNGFKGVLEKVLGKLADEKVNGLEKEVEGLDKLKEAANKAKAALKAAKDAVGKQNGNDVDPYKNLVSAAIDGIQKVLVILEGGVDKYIKDRTKQLLKGKEHFKNVIPVSTSLDEENALLNAINDLISICNSSKCPTCDKHSTKCGKRGEQKICDTCHQQYMDGTPSPLQAFLEDRLPGFSCKEVPDNDNPTYPPAASHLGHCGGSGQCCPLPMGFRNNFQDGVTNTGQRLYGILYFFSNGDMMQSCVYTLVRVTAALSATTPQVLGDVFGFFRGGVGEKESGMTKKSGEKPCGHTGDPSKKGDDDYFCGWCASGLRDEVKRIGWIKQEDTQGKIYRGTLGTALIDIKGEKDTSAAQKSSVPTTPTSLSALTKDSEYLSPLTGELYTAVSATFGGTYLSWVLYLSDALEGGLKSLSEAFLQIECRGCRECDPNKCKKGHHGDKGSAQCNCSSIVSCTGVLPVLYRHGFSYGNPFNLEGYQQGDGSKEGDYSIEKKENGKKHCHEFLESLQDVIRKKEEASKQQNEEHPLSNLLSQVGQLQYDIRLPWIFVLTIAWLVAVLYLAFGAIWPLDWTHMRSHWLRGGEHQWQCMWYKVMTGRKGVDLMEYFGRR